MNNLDKIIEKYFDGETSIEEERALKQYFSAESIEQKYEIYRPLFGYFSAEQEKEKEVTSAPQKVVNKKQLVFWLSVAASVAILLGVALFSQIEQNKQMQTYVFIDGEKVKDMDVVGMQVLNSIENIEEYSDGNIIESQIDLLDSFIDNNINE